MSLTRHRWIESIVRSLRSSARSTFTAGEVSARLEGKWAADAQRVGVILRAHQVDWGIRKNPSDEGGREWTWR